MGFPQRAVNQQAIDNQVKQIFPDAIHHRSEPIELLCETNNSEQDNEQAHATRTIWFEPTQFWLEQTRPGVTVVHLNPTN